MNIHNFRIKVPVLYCRKIQRTQDHRLSKEIGLLQKEHPLPPRHLHYESIPNETQERKVMHVYNVRIKATVTDANLNVGF